MSTSQPQARQDRPAAAEPVPLTAEQDATRIAQLKASRGSHHTAGGCAEEQARALSSYRRMVRTDLL